LDTAKPAVLGTAGFLFLGDFTPGDMTFGKIAKNAGLDSIQPKRRKFGRRVQQPFVITNFANRRLRLLFTRLSKEASRIPFVRFAGDAVKPSLGFARNEWYTWVMDSFFDPKNRDGRLPVSIDRLMRGLLRRVLTTGRCALSAYPRRIIHAGAFISPHAVSRADG